MSGRLRSEKDRAIKEALLSQMRGKVPLDDVIEWLWDDFGIRASPDSWDSVERLIVTNKEVLPQDVAVFMIDEGIMPDEGAWDAVPVPRGLRGAKAGKEDNNK